MTAAAFRREPGALALVHGHRGVRGEGMPIENTMEAFIEAERQNADGIELDVRATSDGALVCVHDPTLDRITGGVDKRPVAALTLAAVRRVELPGGGRIAELDEAVAYAREKRLLLNVEMKHDTPDGAPVVRGVARALEGADLDRVIVSSFDPTLLARLRILAPKIARAILIHETEWSRLATTLAALLRGSFGPQAAHITRTIATPGLIERLRGAGLIVNVWTVNDDAEAVALAGYGADGLITDRAREIRAALANATRA